MRGGAMPQRRSAWVGIGDGFGVTGRLATRFDRSQSKMKKRNRSGRNRCDASLDEILRERL
jgi:hypothetical protein